MRVCKPLIEALYEGGLTVRRRAWPEGDRVSADGADETLWYYKAADDSLTPGFSLAFHDLGAADWEVERAEDK